MKTFRPFYVGAKRVSGLELPVQSSWIANTGGLPGFARELRFRFIGPSTDCRARLESLNPRLIHAHFGADACEAIPLARLLNLPLIATFHGYDATRTDEGLEQTREGRTYVNHRPRLRHNTSLFIAVSQFIAKKVAEMGLPQEKIRVHYIGVDLQRFRPPNLFSRQKTVLFVGRLVEKKGCSYLIDAMSEIQNDVPDAELIIIGDGPDRRALETRARRSLRKYRFLGTQKPITVIEWMQKASIFSVPSITASDGDAEGFGMVFAEAQACGVPVVSFASGGISEAVAHGETGFLSPERDARQISKSLLLLLKNSELLEKFRRAGRKRAEERFDLEKQTASLERIYEGVIESHRTSNVKLQ